MNSSPPWIDRIPDRGALTEDDQRFLGNAQIIRRFDSSRNVSPSPKVAGPSRRVSDYVLPASASVLTSIRVLRNLPYIECSAEQLEALWNDSDP